MKDAALVATGNGNGEQNSSDLASASSSLGESFRESDEMLENDSESLRERVGDLEKKVYEQRDEILCLRATLADVLRRINNLESNRGVSANSNNNNALNNNSSNLHFKEPVGRLRVYATNSDPARGDWRRSGTPNGGTANQPNLSIARYSRRANHHQSTGSLHSADSQNSSNGLSPSPSPSPYNRTSPSPRNGIPLSPSSQSQQQKNGVVVVGSNGPSPLAKRWSSTSDFSSNPSLFSQNSAMAARPLNGSETLAKLPGGFLGENAQIRDGNHYFRLASHTRYIGISSQDLMTFDLGRPMTDAEHARMISLQRSLPSLAPGLQSILHPDIRNMINDFVVHRRVGRLASIIDP